MDEKQKARYMKDQDRCPYCQSDNINGEGFDVYDSDTIWQRIICGDCKKEWNDIYQFVNVEPID